MRGRMRSSLPEKDGMRRKPPRLTENAEARAKSAELDQCNEASLEQMVQAR
jgi:hypothetical protein